MDDFDDFARDDFDDGDDSSTMVARRDVASSEERALMRDDASLSDDARGRGSFHVTARRPRASRVSEDGLLVRAWGTSGDPADARRMLGDWAETPHFERATLRLFPPGTLDHATGVPRFGKGAEMGADTWSLAREGFDADDGARDETEPPAAAVANVEETDDHHEIEATREGTPGEPPSGTIGGTIVRGNHPTPPRRARSRYHRRALRGSRRGRGYPDAGAEPRGRQSRTRMVDSNPRRRVAPHAPEMIGR